MSTTYPFAGGDSKTMRPAIIRMVFLALVLAQACGILAGQPRFSDAAMQSDISNTEKYLEKSWTAFLGKRFAPPRLVYYSKPTKTGCGVVNLGNAFYCSADNRIYIDTGFIAEVAAEASEKLNSPGNYAGLVVVAHEFGHAVEHASTPLPATEGGADCFAGTAFRSAMADGQFPDYAFEEALFFMEYGSDDKVLGIHLDTPLQIVVGWALYGPLDHGVVEQRQSAFLRGFYGGPNFCSNNMGLPAPRPRSRRNCVALAAARAICPHFNQELCGVFDSRGHPGSRIPAIRAAVSSIFFQRPRCCPTMCALRHLFNSLPAQPEIARNHGHLLRRRPVGGEAGPLRIWSEERHRRRNPQHRRAAASCGPVSGRLLVHREAAASHPRRTAAFSSSIFTTKARTSTSWST